MRILGLDVGTKRIGVALSDPLGITAQPLSSVRAEDAGKAIEEIRSIIETEGVKEVIVGLPLNMNGSQGPKAKEAAAFAEKLEAKTAAAVKMWDERMTTMEAERVMIDAGASRAKRKKNLDKLAAQIILQSYLDSHRGDIK